jgi:hypothetical protein
MALERAVMDASSSESDEDDALRFIPRFNNTDAGMRMEMQEAREAREREAEEGVGGGSIVDQSQFRNIEVRLARHLAKTVQAIAQAHTFVLLSCNAVQAIAHAYLPIIATIMFAAAAMQ